MDAIDVMLGDIVREDMQLAHGRIHEICDTDILMAIVEFDVQRESLPSIFLRRQAG